MKITRNVWLLGMVSLFTDIASQMVYPLLPQFLLSLGAGASGIGLIEGIAESTASLFKTLFGRWSDKSGSRKGFIAAGYALAGLVKPLLFWSISPLQVLGIRFSDRLGKAARGPARDALLASSVAENNKGASFGFHRGMDRLGAFLGPLLALVILQFAPGNLRLVFLWAGVPAVLALVFIPFVREQIREHKQESQTLSGSALRSTVFWIFLAGNVVFTLGNSSNAFLLLKAHESGIENWQIPLLWMVYNAVCTLAAPVFGRWSDKVGRPLVISLAFAFYALLYVGFALAEQPWQVWALFGLYGIYYGLSSGVFKAYIADLVPENDQRGTAFGLFQTATGLALLPASLIVGLIWEEWGSQTAFFYSSILAGLGFLICLPAIRKQKA